MRARSAVWLVAVGLWLGGVPVAAQTRASDEGRVAQATKKGKKKSKAKGKAPATTTGAPAAAPATAPAAPTAVQPTTDSAGVLDLSDVKDDEAAKKELIQQGGTKKSEGAFDFGSSAGEQAGAPGAFDFGDELVQFDLGAMGPSAESTRFEAALAMMSDEDYSRAALEFRYFLDDAKYREAGLLPEAEYQLAKALYKLGFLDQALQGFKRVLEQGPTHKRYRKSVEWLFFISRKVADETPVLAELARFRNVTFPKAYQNEYRYLLSKYLFVQANALEVQRIQAEELARSKSSKAASFDFGAVADTLKSGGAVSFDFSQLGDEASPSATPSKGGGLDFGGGDAAASGGGGGFDFGSGGGGGDSKGGGGFDFGTGDAGAATAGTEPTRQEAPKTAGEAVRQGLELIAGVNEESKFYPAAKYLEGLLFYLDGQDQKAVNSFQEVVRVLNPRSGNRLDPKLREQAFLSLARLHYGYNQFDRSAYYYDQIDRDSENWLTALFEASWAYYRRGDFEKALGNLLTLHSPFFEREYFPESQLVKAIIYFEACRYAETRQIVDDFIERYTVVMKEIERVAASQDAPEKLYDRIAQLQAGADGDKEDVTARLVSIALADPAIRNARDHVRQLQEQLALWGKMNDAFRQSRLGEETREGLAAAIVQHQKDAGEVTRQKFERELYALKGLLGQALRVKLEVARSERETLEAKLRGEAVADETVVPAVAQTVVDDEHQYWPYEGEYWRDELGTYELDFGMCRPLAASP